MNTFTVDQASNVLKSVMAQSMGESVAGLDTDKLLNVGFKWQGKGLDPFINSLTQVITKSIFSIRNYNKKFKNIRVDSAVFGNVARKVSYIDSNDLKDDESHMLNDGDAVDQYKVSKQKALELGFVGQKTYEISKTIFEHQMNTAFRNINEFSSFVSGLYTYVNNKIEKIHEEGMRQTLAGYIAGKLADNAPGHVVHLLTEYNAYTGQTLTVTQLQNPDNYPHFIRWAIARINIISDFLTEYSFDFHTNTNDGKVPRHTPKAVQTVYILNEHVRNADSQVLSMIYNQDKARFPEFEPVSFWQGIATPDKIHIKKPITLAATGALKEGSEVEQANIFAVIVDNNTLSYATVHNRSTITPYNAAGEYYNVFWKFTDKHMVDYSENGVVFLLD